MAGSGDKVTIIGNLGADPDVRDLKSGKKVVDLRVTTTEHCKDRAETHIGLNRFQQ
jgi:single-strand DNA-binding protein